MQTKLFDFRILLIVFFISFSFNKLSGQDTLKLSNSFNEIEGLEYKDFFLPYERIGEIEINKLVYSERSQKKGNILEIELFDEKTYLLDIDRTNINVNGTYSVRGRFKDFEKGYFLLSETNGYINSTISIPEKGKRYNIKSYPDSDFAYIKKLNISELDHLEGAPSLTVEDFPEFKIDEKQLERLKKVSEVKSDERVTVNVMIVYTPSAESWANSNEGSIFNTIASAMESAQLTLDNSVTYIDMVLVNSERVEYTESGNASTDLQNLTEEGNGHMDEVHYLRELYGADLVVLFADVDDVGGIAWLLNNRLGNPNIAFSLTRIQQASSSYTHIHEMGHNMGCHHHKEQSMQPGPTIWDNWNNNRWSAGWRWEGSDNQMYCSVMTYSSGQYFDDGRNATTVPVFSNPDRTHSGVSVGHGADGDNARTLRELRHIISSYYEAPARDTLPHVSFHVKDRLDNPVENAKITINYDFSKQTKSEHKERKPKDNNFKEKKSSVNSLSFNYISSEFYSKKSETIKPFNENTKTNKDGEWIHWDNGNNENRIGTGSPANFSIASRWTPSDLTDYHGMAIDRVSFVPAYQQAIYTINIWRGEDAELIYFQDAKGLEIDEWNTIELDIPVLIDTSEELWFGVNIITQGGHPAGCDQGPHIPGKGNMMYFNDEWSELNELNNILTYNWNLQAHVVEPEPVILYTDSDGNADFNAIKALYSFTAEKDGYDSKTGFFELDDNKMHKSITLFNYILDLEANPSSAGTVEGEGAYSAGEDVSITAIPEDDYIFVHWVDQYGNSLSENANYNYTMPDEDMLVTAIFQKEGETKIVEKDEFELQIFPNPSYEGFEIKSNQKIYKIKIVDVKGNIVNVIEEEGSYIYIEDLGVTAGIYFMQVYFENTVINRQIKILK